MNVMTLMVMLLMAVVAAVVLVLVVVLVVVCGLWWRCGGGADGRVAGGSGVVGVVIVEHQWFGRVRGVTGTVWE